MKRFTVVLFLACLVGRLSAEPSESPPSIFDPGRFEIRPEGHARIYYDSSANNGIYDRAFVSSVTISGVEVMHFAVGKLIWGSEPKTQTPLERILRSLGSALPLVLIEIPMVGAAHEYGHFRAYNLAGMKEPRFISADDRTSYYTDPGVAFRMIALQSFSAGEFLFAGQSTEEVEKFKNDPERMRYEPYYSTIIDADGLNQEQYIAELVGLKSLRGRAHPLDAITFFVASAGTVGYSMHGDGGDISEYVADLARVGIKTDNNQIRVVTQVPKLLSNSSISFLVAWFDYWITGDNAVEPLALELGDFRVNWPNFYSYLTLHGPTVKGVERVSWRNYAVSLSYERSLANGSHEAGLMLEGDVFRWLSVSAEGLRNFTTGGTWAEAEVALRPLALFGEADALSWFEFGAKGYYGRGDTFRREVAGPTLHFEEESTSGVKFFAGLNIKF